MSFIHEINGFADTFEVWCINIVSDIYPQIK